jgi:hypothetical protein
METFQYLELLANTIQHQLEFNRILNNFPLDLQEAIIKKDVYEIKKKLGNPKQMANPSDVVQVLYK